MSGVLPLLYEANGKGKLSKLHNAPAIRELREKGLAPATIFGEVLWQLGLSTDLKPFSLDESLALIAQHC